MPERRDHEADVAVLTGDVIGSTKLAQRTPLTTLFAEAFATLTRRKVVLRPFEVFRGDSFQGLVRADSSLWAATLIRARMRAHGEGTGSRRSAVDARIAIGIGQVDRPQRRVATSDGEAFRLSGRLLETLGHGRHQRRLAVEMAPALVARHGATVVAMLDELMRRYDAIVSGWTVPAAASIVAQWSVERTQAEIADELGISQPAVSQRLRAANADEARRILKLFESLFASASGR